MDEQFDDFKKLINDEFERESEEIERQVRSVPELAGIRADDDLKEKIDRKIEAYEKERRAEIISMLPEEDQEALRLGRQVKDEHAARKRKAVWKRLGTVAAVLVLVFTVGITSVGGPKRLMEIIEQAIGGRAVTKLNSDQDEVLSSDGAKEEDAYQQIKDAFNIEPVRMICPYEEMKFKQIEIDEYLQTAYLVYEINGENAPYIINLSYVDESFGIDMEDELLDTYSYPLEEVTIEVKEYRIRSNGLHRYIAQFEYKEVHYRFAAATDKQTFQTILDYLYFL